MVECGWGFGDVLERPQADSSRGGRIHQVHIPRGEVRQHLRLPRREFVVVDEPLLPRRHERREPRFQKRGFRLGRPPAPGAAAPPSAPSPAPSATPTARGCGGGDVDGVVFAFGCVSGGAGAPRASSPATPAPAAASRRFSRGAVGGCGSSPSAAAAAPAAGAIEAHLAGLGGEVDRALVLQAQAAHEGVVRLGRLLRGLEVAGGAVGFAHVIHLRAPRTGGGGTGVSGRAPRDADERVRGRVRVVAPAGRGTVLGGAGFVSRLRGEGGGKGESQKAGGEECRPPVETRARVLRPTPA